MVQKPKSTLEDSTLKKETLYWYDLGIKKNTDSFLKSLAKFKKDIGRKIFLSMDRAPWHKSKKALEFFEKEVSIGCKQPHSLQPLHRGIQHEYCWKINKRRFNVKDKSFNNLKVSKEETGSILGKAFIHT